MKDKLEPNMYVRTKDSEIHKCLDIYIDNNNPKLNRFMNEWGNIIMFDEIIKASHNIIDLIEIGDYVNGREVVDIFYNANDEVIGVATRGSVDYVNYQIKSIVTKEAFESMSYKLGDDKK